MDSPRTFCADPQRLAALRQCAVLDTPREPEFDDLCRLAADIYQAPAALITLVDHDRQWFKSAWGIDWRELPLEASICAFAICRRDGLVVPDTLADPQLRHVTSVAGEPRIRFYAGAVIRSPDGQPLGSICALDFVPREPDPAQFAALQRLARQVMALLSLRRALKQEQQRRTADAELGQRGEFLRRAIESADDWIETLDLDGYLISTSFLGESRLDIDAAVAGTDWKLAWRGVSRAAVEAALGEARAGRVGRFEGCLAMPDGEETWWEAVLTPILGKHGRPEQLLAVSRNVTARHITAQELAESEARYRALSEISPQAVWMSDAAGWITYVNEYWLRFTGLNLADALGDGWSEVIHPDYCERVRQNFQRHLASGEPYENEIPFRRAADGEYRWFLNCAKPTRGPDGRIRGWIGVSVDIHERKLAQERLAAAERHARKVLDGLPLHIGVFSPEGVLLEVNRPVAEAFGAAHTMLMGQVFTETPYCQQRPELQEKLRMAIASARSGVPSRFDLEGSRPDGKRRIFDISLVPLFDDEHRVTHLLSCALDVTERVHVMDQHGELRDRVGACSDITERRRVEAALRESEARFRSLFENTGVPIFLWEADWFIDANEPAARLLGYEREEFRARRVSWRALTPPGYEELDHRMYEHLLAHGVTPPFSKEYRRKDGTRVPVEMVATLFPGGTRRGVAFVSDISYRERAEAELRQALEVAQRASAAKDDFIAQLSHELRTPLTPVLMTVSALIEEPDLGPALRENLQMILRNVRLEAHLIDDLLDVTRIAHGKLELHLQPCNLHELIEHALRVCDAALQERQIQVTFRAEALRHTVRGDPTRLQQVFWNLINNAVKFTPVGGRIEIASSNPAPERVCVRVRDNGIGIPSDRIPSLFDAFEQGDASVTRQFGGLGLGLAICKGVMELHKGRISVRSAGAGCGAEFAVELAVLAPREMVALRRTGLSHGGDKPDGARDPGPLRILYIEDHENTAQVLSRLLLRAGYEVAHAASVEEGRRLGASGEYDLVISDLGLPDGTGLELMKWLQERHPDLRGIALSGFGTQRDMLASRAAGFSYHLVKPVEWRHLEATIWEAVRTDVR